MLAPIVFAENPMMKYAIPVPIPRMKKFRDARSTASKSCWPVYEKMTIILANKYAWMGNAASLYVSNHSLRA